MTAERSSEGSKRRYTAQESKDRYIRKMGDTLGAQFAALWQEVAYLHTKWAEFVVLYGTKPERIELLNAAAPSFFRMLQRVFWADTLLHIARLTDAPQSGGRANLTIRNLPPLVSGDLREELQRLVEAAVLESKFCRDWRNRHLAHTDLDLAVSQTALPLEPANRKQVSGALRAIAEVLNLVEGHYVNSTTGFSLGMSIEGATDLLYVLHDGIKADELRRERHRRREWTEDDRPRDL